MASPSSALSTVDNAGLGHYAEARFQELSQGMVATRLFPVTPVAQVSGTFGKITLEDWLQASMAADIKRAPGAGYARLPQYFTTDTYACEEYGIEVPVDDREKAMYRGYLEAERYAVDKALHTILLEAERRMATLLHSSTWSGTASRTNAAGAAWNSTGNPLTDITTARKDFFLQSGYYPNTLLVTQYVFDVMKSNSYVTAAIASSGAGDRISMGLITENQVAQAVGVDRVVVARGAKAGSTTGTAASIWTDTYAMLLRVAETGDFSEPCIGRTFHFTPDGSSVGGTVEMYREESRRADIVRVRHDVDEKLLHIEMGFLITGVTA